MIFCYYECEHQHQHPNVLHLNVTKSVLLKTNTNTFYRLYFWCLVKVLCSVRVGWADFGHTGISNILTTALTFMCFHAFSNVATVNTTTNAAAATETTTTTTIYNNVYIASVV